MNPKFKKVLTYAAYIFTALLIVFVSVILYFNMTGKTFFVFNRAVMWVKTGSMEPEIPERSYILVKKATGEDVKVGDVIIFYSSDPELIGQLNTHRVISIENGGSEFVTKGDNNPGIDKQTALSQNVIGIYVTHLPFLSLFGRFLSTSLGITVMVFLIFVIIFSVFLPDIIGALREKSKKERFDELVKKEIEKLKAENAEKPEDNKEK